MNILTKPISSTEITEQYDKLTDEQSPVFYIGEAAIGSLPSAAAWRIKRITVSGSIATTVWADSTESFNKIWDNRTGYTY